MFNCKSDYNQKVRAGFEIFVISEGHPGLYRSILSIWQLVEGPSLVTILSLQNSLETAKKTLHTVKEDTQKEGPLTELQSYTKPPQLLTSVIELSSECQVVGFLRERDMFLPEYSQVTSKILPKEGVHLLGYFQRKRWGNSKTVITNKQVHAPISTLILNRKLDGEFSATSLLIDSQWEVDVSGTQRELVSRVPEACLVIQSNTKSPYGGSFSS